MWSKFWLDLVLFYTQMDRVSSCVIYDQINFTSQVGIFKLQCFRSTRQGNFIVYSNGRIFWRHEFHRNNSTAFISYCTVWVASVWLNPVFVDQSPRYSILHRGQKKPLYTVNQTIMYQSNRSLNIPPPARQPPGHLNFWKICVKIPPPPQRLKSYSNAPL